jgi:hypothetical protein
LELFDEVGLFATREGVRFAGVPTSLVGERERNLKFFWKWLDVFTRVLKYFEG